MPFLPKIGTKGKPSAVPPAFTQKLCVRSTLLSVGSRPCLHGRSGANQALSPGALSAGEVPLFAEVEVLFSPSLRFV